MSRKLKLEIGTSRKITLCIDELIERVNLYGTQTLEEAFAHFCISDQGIAEHEMSPNQIWTIVQIAAQCSSAVEFGVRRGVSTLSIAFGLANSESPTAWFNSYDIVKSSDSIDMEAYTKAAKDANVSAKFILANSRKVEIPETDLLFVDSYHSYSHFMEEMRLHSHRARKYIIMHDSSQSGTFGLQDQKEGYDQDHDYKNHDKEGMYNAAMDFAKMYSEDWEIFLHDNSAEGLTVFVTKNKDILNDDFWPTTTPYRLVGETF